MECQTSSHNKPQRHRGHREILDEESRKGNRRIRASSPPRPHTPILPTSHSVWFLFTVAVIMVSVSQELGDEREVSGREIRILEAITPSTVGGAEVFVVGISRVLADMGVQVDVFCPSRRAFLDYAIERGVRPTTWRTFGKVDPATVARLVALIKATRADVIHTHLSTASLLGALAAKIAGVPSVAHVHGLNVASAYKYSTAMIAVSDAVKDHLCSQGIPPDRIKVIHNGVDLGAFDGIDPSAAKREIGCNSAAPVVGVFGRLSAEKGQALAVQAMALIARKHPTAMLLVVGKGKDRAALERTASELNIADRVRFAGFSDDVPRFMSACDIVISPSLKEGLGLVAIEAMALAKPVVASAVGGLNETVVHGETGFLIPPNDPDALARSVNRFIEDKPLAERMGALGRKRAEEQFDTRKQVSLLLDAIRETVGNGRSHA